MHNLQRLLWTLPLVSSFLSEPLSSEITGATAPTTTECSKSYDCDRGLCVGYGCYTAPDLLQPVCGFLDCDDCTLLNIELQGSVCSTREVGSLCITNSDCFIGYCVKNTCSDRSDGSPCTPIDAASDCESGACCAGDGVTSCGQAGVCIPATGNTPVGFPCKYAYECTTGHCGDEVCRDGRQGAVCTDDEDCDNNTCVFNVCTSRKVGADCEKDSDCDNDTCVRDKCTSRQEDAPCESAADCDTTYCLDLENKKDSSVCREKKQAFGESCTQDNVCQAICPIMGAATADPPVCIVNGEPADVWSNGICVKNECRDGAGGSRCEHNADCEHGKCKRGNCECDPDFNGRRLEAANKRQLKTACNTITP